MTSSSKGMFSSVIVMTSSLGTIFSSIEIIYSSMRIICSLTVNISFSTAIVYSLKGRKIYSAGLILIAIILWQKKTVFMLLSNLLYN
jgi:hypothetical protein